VYWPREAEDRAGTLTGLAFYLPSGGSGGDPEGRFYKLVCDYRFGTGSLSLAYLGADVGRQPLEPERWPLLEQIAPTAGDGWRGLRVEVDAGVIELYLDDWKLNERPLPAEGMSMRAKPASTPGTWERPTRPRHASTISIASSAEPCRGTGGGPHTGPAGAGSAFVRLALLVGWSRRAQHAQKPLRNLLVQEILAEFSQRLIELRIATFGCRPDLRSRFTVLRQAEISREWWVGGFSEWWSHAVPCYSRCFAHGAAPACSDSTPRLW
jgi:hypothetical protein